MKQYVALELERWRRHQLVKMHPLQQLFWECTLRCNLHCLHCGSDCHTACGSLPDAAEFLSMLDREVIPHCNPLPLIILSGGEPTTREDLEDIGRALQSRGLAWGMVTNGMELSPERFRSLLEAGLVSMSVSLDGLEPEHNWLRGSAKAFASAMRVVDMAVLAQKQGRLAFDVVTCVHPRNIGSLDAVRWLLEQHGVKRWRLFSIAPMGRAERHPDLLLSSDQYRELMEYIAAEREMYDANRTSILASYACEGFLGEYEGRVRNHLFHCAAGVSVASVLADGSISACTSIRGKYYQGNIRTDSFWEVWEHRFDPYRHREWMRQTPPCSTCKMFRYCEGNGMHLRREDGVLMHCNYLHLKG